jgi:Acetyltransferases
MRKALDIEPYNFYSDIEQIRGKISNIFMLIHNEIIIGSVGCYGTEIDNLIVSKQFQRREYGKTLLLWAIRHIRTYTDESIIIHVATCNQNAIKLYMQNGFVVTKKGKVN